MIRPLVWAWVALSLAGAALVAAGCPWWGQVLWLVSNSGLAIHNAMIKQRAQAGLFVAFQALAAIGVIRGLPWS